MAILDGKVKEHGFLTRERIRLRMLERLSWYELLEVLGTDAAIELAGSDLVARIRNPELRKKYEFISRVLSERIVSFTGWGVEYLQEIKHTLFSNRWYRSRQTLL